jgi:hypothetical protein
VGNFNRDMGGHDAALNGDEEPVLPVFQQVADGGNVVGGEVDLCGDLGSCVLSQQ